MRGLPQIAALLQVQLRSLHNSMRGQPGSRSLKVSLATAIVWYGFWLFAAVGAAALPSAVGVQDVEAVLPGIFLFIMAYWQLAPLLTLSLGVSLDTRRLAFYPISIPTLFAVECVLRLGTGAEMALLLAGFWAGLALAGSSHSGPLTLAFLLFVVFNVFLSVGVRNLVERVFHQRRLREALLVLLICGTLLPQLFVWSATARRIGLSALGVMRELPFWALPSDIAARISTGEGGGEYVFVLLVMTAAAGVFGYLQFRNGYQPATTTSAGSSRGNHNYGARWSEKLIRLPSRFFSDPIAALVEKEIRYLWRSPRFRLPFFMGFTFGVIAWVPLITQWKSPLTAQMKESTVTVISIYSFLLMGPVMFLNRFGFDRGASRFYFWLPLRFKELLLAKNLATGFFAAVEVALIAAICWLVGVGVGMEQIAEAVVICSVALLYLLSVGNFMSVRFPAASNPDRISRSGPGHSVRAIVQFLMFPAALAPLGAAFFLRYQTQSFSWFGASVAVVGVGGLALYLLTLSMTARSGEERREELVDRLSEGSGPVASE